MPQTMEPLSKSGKENNNSNGTRFFRFFFGETTKPYVRQNYECVLASIRELDPDEANAILVEFRKHLLMGPLGSKYKPYFTGLFGTGYFGGRQYSYVAEPKMMDGALVLSRIERITILVPNHVYYYLINIDIQQQKEKQHQNPNEILVNLYLRICETPLLKRFTRSDTTHAYYANNLPEFIEERVLRARGDVLHLNNDTSLSHS